MLNLYNTLTKSIEEITPTDGKTFRMYTCGPTVYHFAHIGNLRTYIFADLLRRTLEFNNIPVQQGMNITDVGHLTSDADEGEDKMELGAAREGKHPLEVAAYYEQIFFEDLKKLNIQLPHTILKATDTIAEQIEIIRILEEKDFIYIDESAIYFDTSKLKDYGKLSGQILSDKQVGARAEVVVDSRKKNAADFVLWFFLVGKYKDHILKWDSPWGEGFPGWHIECSAISRKILGQPFDIHTGGVDHIGTHHTNEIAQSEAAFDVPLANVWMHGEFLQIDNKRMGKSESNFLTLAKLEEKGFSPLDYRYLCLTANYRTQLNFTDESLLGAQTALRRLKDVVQSIDKSGQIITDYIEKFTVAINEDLNFPKAVGIIWELLSNNEYAIEDKRATILHFDTALGLGLDDHETLEIPAQVQLLLDERQQARDNKDFTKSDEFRKQIEQLGFEVKDTDQGQQIKKSRQD